LRTRLDVFCATLLSALGATQLVACGGSSAVNGAGSGGADSMTAGAGGASANRAGSSSGGSTQASGGSTQASGGSAQASGGSAQASGGAAGAGSNHGGSGGSSGSVGTAGSANHLPCKNPKDLGSGFEQCDGFKHRKQAQTCTSHVPRPEQQSADNSTCHFDSDCTEKANGWCAPHPQGTGTLCQYGCVASSECATGQLCDCVEPVGQCAAADCVSDADCAPGFLCKGYDRTGGCGSITYTCQSAADACGSDADCPQLSAQWSRCRFDTTKQSFQCIEGTCASGRPFLIDGSLRVAALTARTDWSEAAVLPRFADPNVTGRADLAAHWARIALLEHASIAAFARFTLQLMSLGAPASLIELATAAMSDETKHTKACFAIANHFGSVTIGPGHLDVERSLDESSLEAIVINAIREGCIGETLAAVEAREAAEHAEDPVIRAVLREISADETRHAELAYRFVQWALSLGDPRLTHAVRQEFAALGARRTLAFGDLGETDSELLRYGIVPEARRAAIRSQTIAQVILPCSRALFGTALASASTDVQPSAAST